MLVLLSSVALQAVTVSVDLDAVKTEVPRTLYGTGMEDVNHEIYGGLDAQRLYDESFEEIEVDGRRIRRFERICDLSRRKTPKRAK